MGIPGVLVLQGSALTGVRVPTLPPEAFPLPQQSGRGPNFSAFFTPSAEKRETQPQPVNTSSPRRPVGQRREPSHTGRGQGRGRAGSRRPGSPKVSPSAPGLPASPQPQLEPKLEGLGHHTGQQDGAGWGGVRWGGWYSRSCFSQCGVPVHAGLRKPAPAPRQVGQSPSPDLTVLSPLASRDTPALGFPGPSIVRVLEEGLQSEV